LNFMEKAGFVLRGRDNSGTSTWTIGTEPDKNYAEVTYVGNHDYRVYLPEDCYEIADHIARVLRKVMPQMKYARAFTETVRVPVRRNYLTKL